MTKENSRTATWWSLTPLVFGAFVVAVEGTILTGVLPTLGRDLQVEPGAIGATLAIYPLTYVFGAPTVAMLAGSRSQRTMCAIGLVVFALGNLGAASAGSLIGLTAGRLLASLGACAYLPNAGARAAGLGPERRGRALSIVASGYTAATLAGAPLGVVAASYLGWRPVLVVVAVCAVAVAVAQWFSRLDDQPASTMSMRERLKFLGDRRLLSILALTLAVVTAEFVVYAYISVVVGHNIGADSRTVATALMVFGVGTTTGTLAGGFLVDRFGWRRMLRVSTFVIGVALLVMPFARSIPFLFACLVVWGLFGWTFTPTQMNRLLDTFPDNGTMLLTLNASAVQLGVAGGGLAGGVVLETLGAGALAFAGAAIVWIALVVAWRGSRAPVEAGSVPRPAGP
ncbi:MFS transporter [Lentzea aerocolonigenes]|uniref:MFS transporter n=1 Tax=Lentzea aerocolonigenes TaxID=68170 RepID=UPI0004C3CE8C|nr:MFS transporter [Lentzea aerocolonigenes]MCP2250115.1 MFS transporter, DHA1 family, putative efflux transporter [Lentzea aerocolonigenes]